MYKITKQGSNLIDGVAFGRFLEHELSTVDEIIVLDGEGHDDAVGQQRPRGRDDHVVPIDEKSESKPTRRRKDEKALIPLDQTYFFSGIRFRDLAV